MMQTDNDTFGKRLAKPNKAMMMCLIDNPDFTGKIMTDFCNGYAFQVKRIIKGKNKKGDDVIEVHRYTL